MNYRQRFAAEAAQRRAELAELIANEDISLSEAGRRLGITQQRVSQMWALIKQEMGDQAR